MKYSIPYGESTLEFDTAGGKVIFSGEMTDLPSVQNLEEELCMCLDSPIFSQPFASLAKDKKNIVFLVEDNTRETPLDRILPVVVSYLGRAGVPDSAITFLTAPGTHRVMTDEEIRKKLGDEIVRRFKIVQHDATKSDTITDLGEMEIAGYKLPVHINKLALEADLLVGIGNIVPHSDAGFSGGAKIVQPGICDFVTTQATHRAAGFCKAIPLGMIDGNPCREGIDAVGVAAKLGFIINIVKNYKGEIAGIFCGDCIKAHRAGVNLARVAYSVKIDEPADIVVVSSYPADIDFWQGIKGLTSAYFAVKQGGAVILASPCREGFVHNHPLYSHWLASPIDEVINAIKSSSPYDMETDVISAVVALGSLRTIAKARVYMVCEGLSPLERANIHYKPVSSIQEALDIELTKNPDATIGILPQGGISLPVLTAKLPCK